MSIDEIIESGGEITLVIKSSDLVEFADRLVMRTLEGIKSSSIRPEESYLTKEEVAEILHVSLSTLWKWNKVGYLCHIELGGRRLYKKSDIDAVLMSK